MPGEEDEFTPPQEEQFVLDHADDTTITPEEVEGIRETKDPKVEPGPDDN
jgi:hypothetical protein